MKNVVTFCRAMLYISAAQGSVLGLLLFVLYTADVMKIALQHGVNIYTYADDVQTYASCQAADQQSAINQLLQCVDDIDKWMSSNRLKLNADKTEFLWIGTCQQLLKVSNQPMLVGGQPVTPVKSARNLRVLLLKMLS